MCQNGRRSTLRAEVVLHDVYFADGIIRRFFLQYYCSECDIFTASVCVGEMEVRNHTQISKKIASHKRRQFFGCSLRGFLLPSCALYATRSVRLLQTKKLRAHSFKSPVSALTASFSRQATHPRTTYDSRRSHTHTYIHTPEGSLSRSFAHSLTAHCTTIGFGSLRDAPTGALIHIRHSLRWTSSPAALPSSASAVAALRHTCCVARSLPPHIAVHSPHRRPFGRPSFSFNHLLALF